MNELHMLKRRAKEEREKEGIYITRLGESEGITTFSIK
jgi:hypothetical protein